MTTAHHCGSSSKARNTCDTCANPAAPPPVSRRRIARMWLAVLALSNIGADKRRL